MASLVFFVIALVVILAVVFKSQNFYGNIGNSFLAILVIIFIITLGYVYLTNSTDITSFEGVVDFFKLYLSWLGSLFTNTKEVVGYAIKQDWLSNNLTNVSR